MTLGSQARRVLTVLTEDLEMEVRVAIERRAEAMARTIGFLKDRQDENLTYLLHRGWSTESIEIICSLLSFYQSVLGPLMSSTRETPVSGIGRSIPIRYGNTQLFDELEAESIKEAYWEFEAIISTLNISFWWLQANRADDLVYKMRRDLEDQENEQ